MNIKVTAFTVSENSSNIKSDSLNLVCARLYIGSSVCLLIVTDFDLISLPILSRICSIFIDCLTMLQLQTFYFMRLNGLQYFFIFFFTIIL